MPSAETAPPLWNSTEAPNGEQSPVSHWPQFSPEVLTQPVTVNLTTISGTAAAAGISGFTATTWQRPTADTPICVASCQLDGADFVDGNVPAVCPQRQLKSWRYRDPAIGRSSGYTSDLPSQCPGVANTDVGADSGSYTAAKIVGSEVWRQYTNPVWRVQSEHNLMSCTSCHKRYCTAGGRSESSRDPKFIAHTNPFASTVNNDGFGQDGDGFEPSKACRHHCESHPDLCKDTCKATRTREVESGVDSWRPEYWEHRIRVAFGYEKSHDEKQKEVATDVNWRNPTQEPPCLPICP